MTTGPPEPIRLDELARRWQVAEDKLYPVVLVRPEAYASAVTLVRAVADRLCRMESAGDLAAAYDAAGDLVADAVRQTGVGTEGLDLGLVAGAAFNVRYRELRAEADRERAKQRIRDAAREGQEWVVLFETGRADLAPLTPYRRLEMRLADGFGVHASITLDPSAGSPVYSVETVQLDPTTGDWLHDAEPADGPTTYASRDDWQRALAAMRAG